MTTNGTPHPIPSPQPGDLAPERRPVKRTLFVEEETDVGREAWEATDRDLLDECLRRGLLTDEQCREMLSGSDTDSSPVNGVPLSSVSAEALRQGIESAKNGESVSLGSFAEHASDPLVGTTPSGEAVRMAEQPVDIINAHVPGVVLAALRADKERYVDGVIAETMKGEPVPPGREMVTCGQCGWGYQLGGQCGNPIHHAPLPNDYPLRMVGAERAEVERFRWKAPNGIVIDKLPGRCGGKACIEGTRLYCSLFVGLRNAGETDEKMLFFYPSVSRDQLSAVWAYYNAFREEIDAELADAEDVGVELQDASPEQLKRELGRRAEVGKMPSERAAEIMRARLPPPADGGHYVAMISTYDVLAMLDERLGRGGA